MRYSAHKEFEYDPEIFGLSDTTTALKIYDEWVRKFSPQQPPAFFEVDSEQPVDPVRHFPTSARTKYTKRSPIRIPAIIKFQKPDWRLNRNVVQPRRPTELWLSHLSLKQLDYFPRLGDLVSWSGYRWEVVSAFPPPESYWQQTNVWMGLLVEVSLAIDGDARPVQDYTEPAPSEIRQAAAEPPPVNNVRY
jgi:hypothetical protein